MISTHESSTRKLPVRKVLAGAFSLPWEHRRPLARAIVAPLLLVTAVGLAGESELLAPSEALEWLWVICYVVPAAWLAVNIHRFLLSDLTGAHAEAKSRNWKRLALYASGLFAFWMFFYVVVLILVPVDTAVTAMSAADSASDLEQTMESAIQFAVVSMIAMLVGILIGARLCLVWPAIAVDGDVRAAIRAARGNTLRLTVIFALLPVALSLPAELLLGEEASFVGAGLLVVFGTLVMVVEVAALSLSYRELTSPAPPPTDPPA